MDYISLLLKYIAQNRPGKVRNAPKRESTYFQVPINLE